MTIAQAFKKQIEDIFLYTIFCGRDAESIKERLNTKAKVSKTSFIPKVESLLVNKIDETHDKLTFIYDDISFDGAVTWKKSSSGFVLMKII